jgi:hypothetical protein
VHPAKFIWIKYTLKISNQILVVAVVSSTTTVHSYAKSRATRTDNLRIAIGQKIVLSLKDVIRKNKYPFFRWLAPPKIKTLTFQEALTATPPIPISPL